MPKRFTGRLKNYPLFGVHLEEKLLWNLEAELGFVAVPAGAVAAEVVAAIAADAAAAELALGPGEPALFVAAGPVAAEHSVLIAEPAREH